MRHARAPEPDRSAARGADQARRPRARPGSLLALQQTAGNRAVGAVLAREPHISKRWGDEAGKATYLDVSPKVMSGRLHLPDLQALYLGGQGEQGSGAAARGRRPQQSQARQPDAAPQLDQPAPERSGDALLGHRQPLLDPHGG